MNTLYSLITFASYICNRLHQRLPLVHLSPPFSVPPPPLPERKKKRWKNEEVQLNTDSNVNEKFLR